MDEATLRENVAQAAEQLEVPGLCVGVYHAGAESYATHGVTNVEHPLPVDTETLFAIGSTGKTFTATAVMCLVDQGRANLEEPVRKYVPDLTLADPRVAEEVTLLHLLNHTAGWEGDVSVDTGEGDDALARYVQTLAELPQNSPLGGPPSYNNAALCLAGHVIESITGQTYERALRELVLEPVGLRHTYLSLNDIVTRRFASGHQQRSDGTINVVRPWSGPRSGIPAGTRIASTVTDQLAWARFHLGDGRGTDGTRVLSGELLHTMRRQTSGGEGGERYGIAWRLREVGDARIVAHGGHVSGQISAFEMVPDRDYAITILTNCGPNGQELCEQLVRMALEAHLGIVADTPEPLELGHADLEPYTGVYETGALRIAVTIDGGRLLITSELQPEEIALARDAGEEPEDGPPPFHAGILGDDRFLITDGPYQGHQSYFVRGDDGLVNALHMGRLARRVDEQVKEGQ